MASARFLCRCCNKTLGELKGSLRYLLYVELECCNKTLGELKGNATLNW